MRVAFIADLHVDNHKRHGGALDAGINRRCAIILATLRAALSAARHERVDALVILGDLCDTDRPSPQVVAAIMHALDGGADPLPVYVIAGNHDIRTDAPGDHALAPLYPVAEIVDAPRVVSLGRVDLLLLPFLPGKSEEAIPAAIEAHGASGRQTILCIHAGIADDSTPPYLRDAHDAIRVETLQRAARSAGVSHVFAGNWHNPRIWPGSPAVVQVGTLTPTGWDNPGMGYGLLAILDVITGEVSTHTIPGPRFLFADRPEQVPALAAAANGCRLFVRLTVPAAEFATAKTTFGGHAPIEGVEVVEVLVDDTGRKEEARQAAEAARSRVDFDEASAAYVEKMPLAEGVDRRGVVDMVRGYLGGVA